MLKKQSHGRMKIYIPKKEPHSCLKISMHVGIAAVFCLWLKSPNIALSLALHWLPGKGCDCQVFVLWACSCSARRWLDLPWTRGRCDSPASTDAENSSRSLHYIRLNFHFLIILVSHAFSENLLIKVIFQSDFKVQNRPILVTISVIVSQLSCSNSGSLLV